MAGSLSLPSLRTSHSGREWLAAAGWIGLCLAVGGLGSWLTNESVNTWYRTLERPPLTPPGWVFGPVWTTLYVLMGTAAWLVWRRRREVDVRGPLALFGVQLAFNLAWSALFFYWRMPGAALVEIVVLECLIAATALAFRPISRTAAGLLVPYAAWVAFATYLNAAFWILNR